MKNYIFFILFALIISTSACLVMENPHSKLAPGPWRAVLKLVPPADKEDITRSQDAAKLKFEEVSNGELPFTFEVKYTTEEDFYIEIINGEERIPIHDITYGLDRSTAKDTLIIDIPIYESYIRAIYSEKVLEGEWIVKSKKDYSIPFVAWFGQNHRFTRLKKTPKIDLTGKWETYFGIDGDDPEKAIGEFKQDGNHLLGTFRTETGDYRFLEGTVQDNKVYLSCFDGSHAFLFEAKIQEDNSLLGSFRSGKHYQTMWKATKNPDIELTDPDSLTYLNEGYDKIEFAFANPAGKMISLADEAYQNKVKIVQILGTWCPNCRDETSFLVDYKKQHPNQELEIISLAYERYKDADKSNAAIRKYKDLFGIDYEMVYAGHYNKKEAAKTLPMLNHILSYPTMIFIDKNDKVRRIHTGFSGPATSKYAEFEKEFDDFIKILLKE